jgi:hypothetical protein
LIFTLSEKGVIKMKFGSIDVVVDNPDEAVETWLKLLGTNNVSRVLKIKGLYDTVETVDGYYIHSKPIHIGIWKPRDSTGNMGQFLKKTGGGIHHMTLHLNQEDFTHTHNNLKSRGWAVSEKPIFIGRLSEAIFWLDESGEQNIPVKFATKCNHTFYPTDFGCVSLDTPKSCELYDIKEEHLRPNVEVITVVIVVKDLEKHIKIWSQIFKRFPKEMGGIGVPGPHIRGAGNDYRGNTFEPVTYLFGTDDGVTQARVNMYHAVGGPEPPLLHGTGNYFFFTHPVGTHGVLHEFVSLFERDEDGAVVYDYRDVEVYMVKPDPAPVYPHEDKE